MPAKEFPRKSAFGRIRTLIAALAIIAIALGLLRLSSMSDGVTVSHLKVGSIPVTLFEPASLPAPTVVIAHGFAGSQQLMQPFALTLARNGYLAVTFDFPGHGRNPLPLPADLTDQEGFSRALQTALDQVIEAVRKRAESDGRIAVLGHSMASDIVVRYAQAHPEIAATVAVSLFSPGATATRPRNLLIIDGALEAGMLRNEAFRIVNLTAAGKASPSVTYGSFSDGTARRLALARGVEHIGVLYSRDSMEEALAWMNAVFQHRGSGVIDSRGRWLGLLYLGLIGLAWALVGLLPQVSNGPLGAGLSWRRLLPVAIAPAVLTPLILWKLPTSFLPILLGDYLVLHFGLYGLLTAAGLYLSRNSSVAQPVTLGSAWRFIVAAGLAAAYGIFAVGLPIDRYITSFLPGTWRLPLIPAMLAGTLPYFLADEWLTRGNSAVRGGYAVTKLCFLVSLAIAVGLNLPKLFFLVIIVPVILLLFIVYGMFSNWIFSRTRQPLVAAVANALAFAWFIAVAFPIVKAG